MQLARSFLILLLLAAGCTPDPAPAKTYVELLTERPWIFWTSMARMNDSDTWRELPFTKPDQTMTISRSLCAEDDVYIYLLDGTMLRNQGNSYCNGSNVQQLTGRWSLVEDNTKLRADFGSGEMDFTITSLTEDVLKLEWIISGVQVQTTYSHQED
jgi:hypothetical protein